MQTTNSKMNDFETRRRTSRWVQSAVHVSNSSKAVFRLRRGFTLIELLVVIAIISAVTIATVPMILPALDVRRIREASRVVTTHFASAQSEAIATGRPVGVWIERLPGTPTAAMDLFLCEVPPPYSGSDYSTGGQVVISGITGPPKKADVTFNDTSWSGLLHPGDLVRFGNRGPYYVIDKDAQKNPDGSLKVITPAKYSITPADKQDYDSSNNPQFRCLPPSIFTGTSWTTTFQVIRQPVKSAGSQVQLPAGAVIDLFSSGMTSVGYMGAGSTGPVLVLFNKSGAIDSVYSNGSQQPVTAPLYFLIGKRNKLPPQTYNWQNDTQPLQGEKHNFRDLENIWVSINPQTGLATAAEAAEFTDSGDLAASIDPVADTNALQSQGKTQPEIDAILLGKAIGASRRFATSAQSMGGR